MSEFVLSNDERILDEEIDSLCGGGSMSAVRFLSLMEYSDELTVEENLDTMKRCKISLNITDLPPAPLSGSNALRLKQEAQFQSVDKITAGLDENDPLCLYLQELAATPAAGDVQLYAERYLTGEHHLAEMIVNLCLRSVLEIAVEHTGYGVLLLDLIQEGSMGLLESLPNYTGGDFLTHAGWWIRQAMARSIVLTARANGMGQMLRKDMEDYRDADQRLLVELGRNPTVEEIAQSLHISVEECTELEKLVMDARSAARSKVEQPEQETQPEEDQAVEDTAYFQLRQRIQELLSGLSPTDAKLLTLRFGLEGGKPLSPAQVGGILGLTPEEVVTREEMSLAKLRNI